MSVDLFSEELLARYLLGDLTEEEQVEVEARAFQDHDYLRSIEAAESDLIDTYVRGELSERERRQFEERFFASAERRRKVEFARALARVAPEFAALNNDARPPIATLAATAPATSPATWRDALRAFLARLSPATSYALAAAALLVVIGGAWLIAEGVRLRGQLAELRAAEQTREREQQALQQQIKDEQARRETLAAELQRERDERERNQQLASDLQRQLEESTSRPSPPAVVSLALWPGMSRGNGARPKLTLAASVQSVRLEVGVEPEDQYRSFRAELRTQGGATISSQGNLSARRVRGGRAIVLNLPARLLKPGNYELLLKGVTADGTTEDVAYHYFEVIRK